jgi:hypothetical protein
MKLGVISLIAVIAACLITGAFVTQRDVARFAEQMSEKQAVWLAERAELQAALDQARNQPPSRSPGAVTIAGTIAPGPARPTATEIIARLRALRDTSGPNRATTFRQAVVLFDELLKTGPEGLPAIREFLASNVDYDLDTTAFQGKSRDRVPLDFVIPPSLRLGMLDVLRRMPGPDAEFLLSEALAATGRGCEVEYLATVLQERTATKYRELSIAIARKLLSNASTFSGNSPLDRNHRDYLFAVLTMFGDAGFSQEAQAQLVQTPGQLDRAALKYLQETLGPQSVPVIAQAYQNPSLTNSSLREPLARAALAFVGTDAQANEFYAKAINDPVLTKSHRKNLIEDLNEDGFADPKNLSDRDLPLIQNRISLIEKLAPEATDPVNTAAFQEAYKDLVNMRAKIAAQNTPNVSSSKPAQP